MTCGAGMEIWKSYAAMQRTQLRPRFYNGSADDTVLMQRYIELEQGGVWK
jgi:hypothetical protein